MTGSYDFDFAGRLTGMSYTDAALATIRSFAWSYDAAHRVIGHDSDIAAEDVAAGGYAYDATDQLTGANYTDAGRDDETYAYDENGNRTGANGETYTTGDNNQTTGDGVYRYLFDDEGNRTLRFVDEDLSGTLNAGDTDITEYAWDHRNRLTEVAHRAVFGGAVDWEADYVYDLFDRRIGSLYDDNGDATPDRIERYVWEGRNVALDFVDPDGATGGGQSAPLALATRYLWGPAVDQLLAQETVDNGGPEDVRWPVTDNLGSVRSLVDSSGTITATYSYDTFGTVTVLAGSLTDTRYLFTCQEYDLRTASYYYDARWYDPATGKFVSEDPKEADINLYRYCGNNPVVYVDPSGLAKVALPAAGAGTILPATTNVPMAWYRRPYWFAPFLPQKPNIIKNVGEVKPTNCGIGLTGVTGGNHQVAGRPLAPNTYFGVEGAGPCIGVVVVCPGQVVAFHLSATDDAGATLGQYTWPNNCNAVICGGDNSAVSNDQLVEVINSLKQNGIKLDGMINMTGCYYGPGGKWYVGSATLPSQDTQKK